MRKSRRWASTEESQSLAFVGGSPILSLGGVSDSKRQRNHLYFYEEVNDETVLNLVSELRETALEVEQEALALEVAPPPLHIHIKSHGGDLFSGFAAYDAIRECPLEVHTHIEGAAASAATLISIAGTHRTIGRNAFILVHQLSSWFEGTYENLKDEMSNSTLIMRHIKNIYKEHACFPERKLVDVLKRDLWLDPQTALKYGLVDAIR